MAIKEITLFSFLMTDSLVMIENIKEIPLFSFVVNDSFVMTENIKEISLFSFVMNSFVMTDKHTHRIVFQYGVELIATLPSGKYISYGG